MLVLEGACAEPEALSAGQDHPSQTADIGLTGRIHFNIQTGDFARSRALYRMLGFTAGVGGFPKTNTYEMALDRLGGVELTIVYCTMCGMVIPFESVAHGRRYRFGTSGLLYRSNELIFDHETHSLWNTFEGVPVVGALAGSGLRLTPRAVVTTTWGEWRRQHPATNVPSLDTGHRRDFAQGRRSRGKQLLGSVHQAPELNVQPWWRPQGDLYLLP